MQSNTLTITELNRQIRLWMEDLAEVFVVGEISNLSKPASGHLYFSLKDERAQIRCVHFRNVHTKESAKLQEGQQVIARGKLSLYEARGDYQLIVQQLTPAGLGDLFQQFEQLKLKLSQLGLFSAERKKNIPSFPKAIGIITSPTGAALRDILTTLNRRYPLATIYIYPCEVQGKNSAQQLVQAIETANQDKLVEVLILARGGGSIEDLWSFNNEHLAHCIFNSNLPIVTGVGHETDFTIADFVADFRAATPTAAAETVSPNQVDLLATIKTSANRLNQSIHRVIQNKRLILSHRQKTLYDPMRLILTAYQRLDYLDKQLQNNLQQAIHRTHHRLLLTKNQLHRLNPVLMLTRSQNKLGNLQQQLASLLNSQLESRKHQFKQLLIKLDMVSPLATLNRSYAIVSLADATVIRSCDQVKVGDELCVRLAQGRLRCKVTAKENKEKLCLIN